MNGLQAEVMGVDPLSMRLAPDDPPQEWKKVRAENVHDKGSTDSLCERADRALDAGKAELAVSLLKRAVQRQEEEGPDEETGGDRSELAPILVNLGSALTQVDE